MMSRSNRACWRGLASYASYAGARASTFRFAEALTSIQITGDVAELRGPPLTRPVDLHAEILIDGTTARTTLAIRTTKAIPLFDAEARIPFSLDRLRAHPRPSPRCHWSGR